MPSTAVDAAGLMTSAIADPDPIVFIESKALYFQREEIEGEPPAVPLGVARTFRDGTDLTIVATARMVRRALEAADVLAAEGIESTVIDPRTLVPLDIDAITASVEVTNHLMVVEEAVTSMGFGAEIAARVQHAGFDDLDAPVERVGAPFTPVPLSPSLEDAYIPDVDSITRAARRVLSVGAEA
jgi:acetoin:2,6-dichlorophenolindophenol oxidoreductase subunit beta